MKFFHTADWHLGKLVQGVYMTDEQRYVLQQFLEAIKEEKPDAVIISGDLYDRAVPPTEAVNLLDEVFQEIVIGLATPLIAIAGNHDSPSRLHFGSDLLKKNGLYITGRLLRQAEPIILHDEFGEVHFHLVPFADPSVCRQIYTDDGICDFNSAMKRIIEELPIHPDARHVFVGHAFVTPNGGEAENTSESERPLSIGGAEYVAAELFEQFHYTALGHLHQAHYVKQEKIRYAGSPMKYSISEEHHAKGFLVVEMDGSGQVTIEKRTLVPKNDLRTVKGKMEEILRQKPSDDYVFIKLEDESPVLYPMEKVRSVYPNAMHIERAIPMAAATSETFLAEKQSKPDDMDLFRVFYTELQGDKPDEETLSIFTDLLHDVLYKEDENR
ncbi:exonuclease SbcD [Sporosarcina luteola]|nr:exonuclease SbcD [Sporosarcina luteola]